jgi:hypothetical protein
MKCWRRRGSGWHSVAFLVGESGRCGRSATRLDTEQADCVEATTATTKHTQTQTQTLRHTASLAGDLFASVQGSLGAVVVGLTASAICRLPLAQTRDGTSRAPAWGRRLRTSARKGEQQHPTGGWWRRRCWSTMAAGRATRQAAAPVFRRRHWRPSPPAQHGGGRRAQPAGERASALSFALAATC